MKVLHIWWTLGCPVMYIPPVLYPQSPEIPHRRAHTHTELSKNKYKYKNQCRGETLPKFSSPPLTLSFHLAPSANIPAETGYYSHKLHTSSTIKTTPHRKPKFLIPQMNK